jgi:dipeptidyl-peptidase 4
MHPRIDPRPAATQLALVALAALLALPFSPELGAQARPAAQDAPRTGAENVGFRRTTSHDELMQFLFEIQSRTDRMLIQTLTTTDQGRPLPLVILGAPPAGTPGTAIMNGKPTLFITGSVHGNERSGKEGSLQFIRELTIGSQRSLLDSINVLIIPSLNPDGAEAGRRTNSLGYDMNRDFIVLETPEISAVVEKVLLQWWPDVYVDAHNGGAYPYNMTYQTSLPPDVDQALVAYARGPMYQGLGDHLRSQNMSLYWYSGPSRNRETGEYTWGTTAPQMRKQHSYGGLQNVIPILFEVPGRHDLETQAASARESYIGLARFMARDAVNLRRVITEARRRTIARPATVAQEWEVGSYGREQFYVMESPAEGQPTAPRLVTGENRTLYTATRTRVRPWAYAFDGRLNKVAEHLRRHGIEVERLEAPLSTPVERYHLNTLTYATAPYQNHIMATAAVTVTPGDMEFPQGTYVVRTGQNAGTLIAHLFEPDTEDSLLAWNFFDHSMPRPSEGTGNNNILPFYRIMQPAGMKALLIP